MNSFTVESEIFELLVLGGKEEEITESEPNNN